MAHVDTWLWSLLSCWMADDNTLLSADVLKLAECPVCTELKTDHRILVSCGHSFCIDDINQLVKNRNRKCPLCRKPFDISNGVESFVKDFHKIALVELALKLQKPSNTQNTSVEGAISCCACSKEGTLWCQEDECLFCEIHAEDAHRYGKSRTHTLVSPSKRVVKVRCTVHQEAMEVFCLECSKLICMQCFVSQHTGHKIGTVDSIIKERKVKLQEELDLLESCVLRKLQAEQKQLKDACVSINQNFQTEKQRIETYFEGMISLLQRKQQELVNSLEQIEVGMETIAVRQKVISQYFADLALQKQSLAYFNEELSSYEWLAMEPSLREEWTKWKHHQVQPVQFEVVEAVLPDLKPLIAQAAVMKLLNPKKANDRFEQCAFSHDFDTNGVLYKIGFEQDFNLWQNPAGTGKVTISTSHYSADNTMKERIISRDGGIETWWGGSTPLYFILDLQHRKLLCNYFTIRHGYCESGFLKDWEISASNDGHNWEVLFAWDDQTPFSNSFEVKSFPVVDGKDYFRYFRVLQKGNYSMGRNTEHEGLPYMCVNGFELYGELQLY